MTTVGDTVDAIFHDWMSFDFRSSAGVLKQKAGLCKRLEYPRQVFN
jgi:hypothetical protein